MRIWKKKGEKTIFSYIFFSSQILRTKILENRFYTYPNKKDSPLLFHAMNPCPIPFNMKASLSGLLHTQGGMKSPRDDGLFNVLSPLLKNSYQNMSKNMECPFPYFFMINQFSN